MLVQWLEDLENDHYEIANAREVTITIRNEVFPGAFYSRVYRDRVEHWLYLLSDKLPKSYRPGKAPEYNSTHYTDQHDNEWYIAGHYLEDNDRFNDFHPFGKHFDMTIAHVTAYNGTMPDKVVPMTINRI